MPRLSIRLVSRLAAVATMAAVLQPNSALSMTPDETQHIDALAARMTTRCIGRYLIDLPDAFVLNSESRSEVEGVQISLEPMPAAMFDIGFAARKKRLEATMQLGTGYPHLRGVTDLTAPSKGAVFDRAEADHTGRLGRTLELLAWRDGFEIKATINARDNSFPEYENDSIAVQLRPTVREKFAQLLSVYDRIRGRRDDEIPTQAGLCIPNGFVLGAQREKQMVGFVYHLRDSRDVFFTASTYDSAEADTTLLQRVAPQEREMALLGHKVLRKGNRQIHGEEYEEFLPQGPADDGVLGANFYLHGNELRKQRQQPFFVFTFDTGTAIPRPEMNLNEKDRLGLFKPLPKATLSPEQALQLWDTVTPTIRHRPGAL